MTTIARVLAAGRSGAWLTAERARGYAWIVLVLAGAAIVAWVALSDGLIDRNGRPIGTDFLNPYAAGVLAAQGRAADAYDPARLHEAEKQVFGGRDVPFYGWHYPPFFFALALGMAMLPYGAALALWLLAGLSLYLATIRAILPRPETLLLAAAFPAVFVNIGHGQNAFLTTALLGGALVLLRSSPVPAGILIGLLAYKPQFGALIPLALLAGRHWSAFVAATITTLAMCAAATLAFGVDIWRAFMDSATFTRTIILESGATGWEKIQSIFSAVRMLGGDVGLAYAAQGALALALAVSLAWLWARKDVAFDLKAAALATACLLATPYVLDYDLVALAPAIAFFARHGCRHGFRDGEITLLAAAWAMPLLARGVMGATMVPLGLLTLGLLYCVIIRRAARDLRDLAVR